MLHLIQTNLHTRSAGLHHRARPSRHARLSRNILRAGPSIDGYTPSKVSVSISPSPAALAAVFLRIELAARARTMAARLSDD